ncbi:hypothetical protein ACHAXR_012162 [Thalassiosira sp. AJA248-18]
MPSPTKIKRNNPPCRLKPRCCACLAISAAVPIYIYTLTLFFIGRAATNEHAIISSLVPELSSGTGGIKPSTERGTSPHGKIRHRSNNNISYQSIAREIALKWNLTSPQAPYLLEQQFHRINDYNPQTDFLHFYHIPKTAGTSLSDLMNATLGALVDGHRGILPGSKRSGGFEPDTFYSLTALPPNPSNGNNHAEISYPYLASYGHTRLRPIHGPNKTKLASFFEEYFALPHNSKKRLRSLGMLREPMNLRASTQAMALCSLNGKVIDLNRQRQHKGLGHICTPEQGLNISELVDGVVDKAMAKCPKGTEQIDTTKLDRYEKLLCKRGRSALDFCRSPTHLMSSVQYNHGMRSMFKGLMGRFTAQQQMGLHDYYSVEEHLEKIGVGFSVEAVEEYTLVDLGALDSTLMHTAYSGFNQKDLHTSTDSSNELNNDVEPDMLWFGITERMKDSTCLFFYTLNVKPLKETPQARVMKCSPTSWWTEEHREEVKRKCPADYSVWRAANAILDVRMKKMQLEIHHKMENEQSLPQKERAQYSALVDAGCLD